VRPLCKNRDALLDRNFVPYLAYELPVGLAHVRAVVREAQNTRGIHAILSQGVGWRRSARLGAKNCRNTPRKTTDPDSPRRIARTDRSNLDRLGRFQREPLAIAKTKGKRRICWGQGVTTAVLGSTPDCSPQTTVKDSARRGDSRSLTRQDSAFRRGMPSHKENQNARATGAKQV
jgi:hypothetical protein